MTHTDIANLALSKLGEPLIEDIADTGQKSARLANLHLVPTRREVLRAHFWSFANRVVLLFPQASTAFRVTGSLTYTRLSGMVSNIRIPVLRYFAEVNSKTAYRDADNTAAMPSASGLYYNGTRWVLVGDNQNGGTVTWNAQTGSEASPADADWTNSAQGFGGGVPVVEAVDDPELIGFAKAFRLPSNFVKLQMLKSSAGSKIDRFDIRRVNNVKCIVTHEYDSIYLNYVQDITDPTDFDAGFVNAFTSLLAAKLALPLTGNAQLATGWMEIYQQQDLPAARTADAHDLNSNENHPLREFLAGSLTAGRGDFFGKDSAK